MGTNCICWIVNLALSSDSKRSRLTAVSSLAFVARLADIQQDTSSGRDRQLGGCHMRVDGGMAQLAEG